MSFLRDLKIAVRSLSRARALWITVALTLALGIGANAAIFSVVRAVLLRPLANRDETGCFTCARALRASASQRDFLRSGNSGPRPRAKDHQGARHLFRDRLHHRGTRHAARVPAGVVDGNYFEVMGLRPVIGRLLTPADDGPNAAGAIVLTYRFWSTSLHS
jgi:putative ABC transport system permease protein